ncbi:MAG: hypothetical protein HY700_14250 [Gemmatimonadetes bacterium]|nr:hypothetical protein [Gemmatimonadota bacterium]
MRLDRTLGPVVAGAALLAALAAAATAQSTRDSSGIRIISSKQPAWTAAQAFRLGAAPALVIGGRPGDPYKFSQNRGVVRLGDGTIVVADGGSLEVRYFDSTGTFLKYAGDRGKQPGPSRQFRGLYRIAGDTVALVQSRDVLLFTPGGELARVIPNPAQARPRFSIVMAVLPDGARVLTTIGPTGPRARGDRWVDSLSLVLIGPRDTVKRDFARLPAGLGAMEDTPKQVWFSPVGSFAAAPGTFYYGFPVEYSVSAYSEEGRLTRIIRRRWTAQPITDADKDAHTIEWGKRWITSTGAEAERERAEHRNEPYPATLPAFSQMIVDGAGRLWVREAHMKDADLVGELNTRPLVPSTWSVFDPEGRWLCDVTMPTGFLPTEIGRDYVLGTAVGADNVVSIALYRLAGGG